MVDLTIKELDTASERGRLLPSSLFAVAIRYEAEDRTFHVVLKNGVTFSFPADQVQDLSEASDADLAEFEILGEGYALHWEKLNVDFTVGGLAAGIFGTAKYMAQRAGQAKSEAKAAAARANGAAGGRPRKAS